MVLGRRINSTSGATRYAKKIDSTRSRMIPVSLEIPQRITPTANRITMIRRTVRVGTPDASTAACAATLAVSLVFSLLTRLESRVQPSDQITYRLLIVKTQATKFYSERIRRGMMHYFTG